MTSEQRQEYITAVIKVVYGVQEPDEARVVPFEWGVIDAWYARGIPLATVLQTVDQMEKHPSIRYIREAVELEEVRRLRALV